MVLAVGASAGRAGRLQDQEPPPVECARSLPRSRGGCSCRRATVTARRGIVLSPGADFCLRRLPGVCGGPAVRFGGSGALKRGRGAPCECTRGPSAGSRDPPFKFRVLCGTAGVSGTSGSATRRLWTPNRPENGCCTPSTSTAAASSFLCVRCVSCVSACLLCACVRACVRAFVCGVCLRVAPRSVCLSASASLCVCVRPSGCCLVSVILGRHFP